jgi:lysophospholipase L1-like esterase
MNKKILIAFISCTLSLAFFEVALRLVSKRYSDPVTYEPNSKDAFFSLNYGSNFDDTYEKYVGKKSPEQIITLGDSFTNGGNVMREHTYPHLLFELFDKKVSLINMGLCESTTKDTLNRVQLFYSRQTKKIRSTFIILIGAADIFTDDLVLGSSDHKKYLQGVTEYEMNDKFSEETDKFELRIYKLFKKAWVKLRGLNSEPYKILGPLFNKFKGCYKDQWSQKSSCLDKIYSGKAELFHQREIFKQTHSQIHYLNTQYSMQPYRSSVEDLLQYIDKFPRNLIYMDVLFNLVAYTLLQSTYTIEHVRDQIERNYLKEKAYIDGHQLQSEYSNIQTTLRSLNHWIVNRERLYNERDEHLTKMVQLIKSKGDKAILMTYPLPYKKANETTRLIAKKESIPLIDLENFFSSITSRTDKKNHLIDDWEHCTPEGYRLISEEVHKVLTLKRE